MLVAWHHSTTEHLRLEEARQAEIMVSTVFKLVDLCRLYSTRIEELGVLKTARVHSTQLTNRI